MYAWSNEAWFASPAVTLLHTGYLGTTILESKGTWMEGIDRHTYWVPPVYLLLEAGWYRLAGFGLVRQRLISVLAGALVILGWYWILSRLIPGSWTALAAVAITAIEPRFLTMSVIGRPDAVCAALGVLALAAYLHFRNASLPRALLISHTLAAASCLTHPCGILYAGGLILFMLYYDRQGVRLQDFVRIAFPYLLGLAAWGLYVLRSPADFVHQFAGNISGIASEFTDHTRWSDVASPYRAVKREIFLRYGSSYGWYSSAFRDRIQLVPLLIFSIAVLGCLMSRTIRSHPGYRLLLLFGTFEFWTLAMLDGLKATAYLVHTLPLCAALLAIYVHYWLVAQKTYRPALRFAAVGLAMTAFAGIQLATTFGYLIDQPMRQDYDNVLAFLRRAHAPAQIIAAGEFAYALGFDSGMVDDWRLGYYSGKRPQFIVTNPIYVGWFERSAAVAPAIHKYMEELLANDYRMVFRNSNYAVYQRAGG